MQTFDWKSRAQFFSVAARMMRNILVDHARRRNAAKRGGGEKADTLPDIGKSFNLDVLVVNDALDRFATEHARQAQVVELRFFGVRPNSHWARSVMPLPTFSRPRSSRRSWCVTISTRLTTDWTVRERKHIWRKHWRGMVNAAKRNPFFSRRLLSGNRCGRLEFWLPRNCARRKGWKSR